ncbi:MAG TPA: hypothetical protein VJU83_12805 [Burkholderiales bacterium]|nr:hypothetical protein [Burkholderiales bacterium]
MAEEADEILKKAEALLAKHRGTRAGATPPVDFPTLTEVVGEAPSENARHPSPLLDEDELESFERELRQEILQLIRAELERLIEARLHPRIESKVAEVMTRARVELEVEVRRAVRESVTQVIDDEIERLKDA